MNFITSIWNNSPAKTIHQSRKQQKPEQPSKRCSSSSGCFYVSCVHAAFPRMCKTHGHLLISESRESPACGNSKTGSKCCCSAESPPVTSSDVIRRGAAFLQLRWLTPPLIADYIILTQWGLDVSAAAAVAAAAMLLLTDGAVGPPASSSPSEDTEVGLSTSWTTVFLSALLNAPMICVCLPSGSEKSISELLRCFTFSRWNRGDWWGRFLPSCVHRAMMNKDQKDKLQTSLSDLKGSNE